jgi:hypothetical protein
MRIPKYSESCNEILNIHGNNVSEIFIPKSFSENRGLKNEMGGPCKDKSSLYIL